MQLTKNEIKVLLKLSSVGRADQSLTHIYESLEKKRLISTNGFACEITEKGNLVIDHLLNKMIVEDVRFVPVYETKLTESIYHKASNIADHYKKIMSSQGLIAQAD